MTERKKILRHRSSSLDGFEEDFLEGSIVHSVVASPNIRKFANRSKKNNDKSLDVILSFIVVYTMIFFNGCCFTAVVPSVPFYLEVMSAPPTFLGWVVSFYSVGQMFGSPFGGWMADKVSSRTLLTISSTLGLLSSALYALAPTYWFILLARFLTGISAGMEFSVELTFIARNTTKKERTLYLASVTAVNVVGFVMGPALGGLLATLNLTIGGINIDQYTGPGWLLTLMFLVDILLVQSLFRDNSFAEDQQTKNEETATREASEETKLLDDSKQLDMSYGGAEDEKLQDLAEATTKLVQSIRDSMRPPSSPIVLGLIFVQFTVMSAWSVLETITSPLTQQHFGWDVQECNLLFTGGGVVSLFAYVVFVVASKFVQDRWLIVGAIVVCFMGQMLAIDWQELDGTPHFFAALLPDYRNRFLLGYALMNAGFMTARPVTFALYSKLIGSQYQGKYLGWMVAGGSLARTLGPFAAVAIFYGVKKLGVNLLALFGSVGICHVSCLVLVFFLWQQLVPKRSQLHNHATPDVETGENGGLWKKKSSDRSSQGTDITSLNGNSDDDELCHIRTKHVTMSERVTDEEISAFMPPMNNE